MHGEPDRGTALPHPGTDGRAGEGAAGKPAAGATDPSRPGYPVPPAARAVPARAASPAPPDPVPAVDRCPAGDAWAGVSVAPAWAAELVRRADEDRELTRMAGAAPTPERRRRVLECHRANAEALEAIVRRYGWPGSDLVGPAASTAALMILLHAPGLRFRLRCRDLIAQAAADGRCPVAHLAYIADHCAVDLGEPQFYGTRINPATLRPYPVRCPQTLDERRRDIGLAPLEEQMRALRLRG